MIWMMAIVLVVGMSVVIFHKPPVKSMGLGWVPPEQRKPQSNLPQLPTGTTDGDAQANADAQASATAPAPQMPDTFNFNDLFGAKKPPTDSQPRT